MGQQDGSGGFQVQVHHFNEMFEANSFRIVDKTELGYSLMFANVSDQDSENITWPEARPAFKSADCIAGCVTPYLRH